MTAGTWITLVRFNDGSTYRTRALFEDNAQVGIEERIFNADGTLRPLPGGRTSLADGDPS